MGEPLETPARAAPGAAPCGARPPRAGGPAPGGARFGRRPQPQVGRMTGSRPCAQAPKAHLAPALLMPLDGNTAGHRWSFYPGPGSPKSHTARAKPCMGNATSALTDGVCSRLACREGVRIQAPSFANTWRHKNMASQPCQPQMPIPKACLDQSDPSPAPR